MRGGLESEVWPVYSYLGEDWLRTDFAEDSAYGGAVQESVEPH